jgi:hypothetical protein
MEHAAKQERRRRKKQKVLERGKRAMERKRLGKITFVTLSLLSVCARSEIFDEAGIKEQCLLE